MIENGLTEIVERAPWPKMEGGETGGTLLPESVRFQGVRVGYFCLDKESRGDSVVLNRIVSLKEDPNKG